MSGFHTDYITRKIEKEELINKVEEFEKNYEIKRTPYPIATEDQLNELILFLETEKQGFISARVTTLFELLRNFRSFTLIQLEFRYSSKQKPKIKKILQKIPLLLSRAALTRRLRNSGHIELNTSEKSEKYVTFHEMFNIAEKLGLNNIKIQCALLRQKHPELFQNDLYDTWCIENSNFVKLIIKCQKFKDIQKEEMFAKLIGACYNTDRYLRYQTNHPVNEMDLMGSYYADSMYSYKIKRVSKSQNDPASLLKKSVPAIARSPVDSIVQKPCNPHITENLADICNSNIELNTSNNNLDISFTSLLKKQIDSNLNSSDDMKEFIFEGFDFMNVESNNENKINGNLHVQSPVSSIQEVSRISESEKDNSPLYLHKCDKKTPAQEWTKKDAIDRNFQISLKRMNSMGWNDQLLFAGDEITILRNFVHHMNLSKQVQEKGLVVFQIVNEIEQVILGCEKETTDRLTIEVESTKISCAKLNNQRLKGLIMLDLSL